MKIYVRGRSKAQSGSRMPRYRVIATEGGDLRFLANHLRKVDIETIAGDLGAEIVYLPEREHTLEKQSSRKTAKKPTR